MAERLSFDRDDAEQLNSASTTYGAEASGGDLDTVESPPVAEKAPPAAPSKPDAPDTYREVLESDIGINTLLNRLKQSIAATRDFAAFLKKRSTIEEDHAQALKRLSRTAAEAIRKPDTRQGSYSRSHDEITRIQEKVADNEVQFALSLHQMQEDLLDLGTDSDRGRKHWKQSGLNAERRVQDAELAMQKARGKYHQLADEYDRARTGDRHSGRFGLKGPKSAAQVEEDLQRKMQAADADYSSKVQTAQNLRQELLKTLRPQATQALEQLINECDSGLTLQMQKFATFSEKLILSNGVAVTPLQAHNSQGPVSGGLRDSVAQINNNRDLRDYVTGFVNKMGPKHVEPKYERHHTQQAQSSQMPPPGQQRSNVAAAPGAMSSQPALVSHPPAASQPTQGQPPQFPYDPSQPIPPIPTSSSRGHSPRTSYSHGERPLSQSYPSSAHDMPYHPPDHNKAQPPPPPGAGGPMSPTGPSMGGYPTTSGPSMGGYPASSGPPMGGYPATSGPSIGGHTSTSGAPMPDHIPASERPMGGAMHPGGPPMGSSMPSYGSSSSQHQQMSSGHGQTPGGMGSGYGQPHDNYGPQYQQQRSDYEQQPHQHPQSQPYRQQGMPHNGMPPHNGMQNGMAVQHEREREPPTRPVFGVSLDELFVRDGSAVPMVVYQCIQAIELFGLNVEGIYRQSGVATHISKLRSMFNYDGSQVDFRNPENFYHDVNSVAGLLKQFFRDLPDPLFTQEHYQSFVDAARIDDDITRRDSLHAIINGLPDAHYATLRALTLHLYRVQEHAGVNKMGSGNLAICLAPTLMCSSAVPIIADAGWQVRAVDSIVQNALMIFDDD